MNFGWENRLLLMSMWPKRHHAFSDTMPITKPISFIGATTFVCIVHVLVIVLVAPTSECLNQYRRRGTLLMCRLDAKTTTRRKEQIVMGCQEIMLMDKNVMLSIYTQFRTIHFVKITPLTVASTMVFPCLSPVSFVSPETPSS